MAHVQVPDVPTSVTSRAHCCSSPALSQNLGAAGPALYPSPKSWVLQGGEALVEAGLENAQRNLEFGLSAELRV